MEFGIYTIKSRSMTFFAIFVTGNGFEVKYGLGLGVFCCFFFIGDFVVRFRFDIKIFFVFVG
jgi:hypothetical protein